MRVARRTIKKIFKMQKKKFVLKKSHGSKSTKLYFSSVILRTFCSFTMTLANLYVCNVESNKISSFFSYHIFSLFWNSNWFCFPTLKVSSKGCLTDFQYKKCNSECNSELNSATQYTTCSTKSGRNITYH